MSDTTTTTKITFVDMDVSTMLYYLNTANMDIAQYIDFYLKDISSRAFPKNMAFFKDTYMPLDDIMVWDKTPEGMETVKFPMVRIKKFIDVLKIYESAGHEKVDGTIICEKDDDAESYTGYFINLKAKKDKNKLNIKVKASDSEFVPYKPKERCDKATNIDKPHVIVNLDKDHVKRLKDLTSLSVSNEDGSKAAGAKEASVVMKILENTLEISSHEAGIWEMNLPEDKVKVKEGKGKKYQMKKKFFEILMTADEFEFNIAYNKTQDRILAVFKSDIETGMCALEEVTD